MFKTKANCYPKFGKNVADLKLNEWFDQVTNQYKFIYNTWPFRGLDPTLNKFDCF